MKRYLYFIGISICLSACTDGLTYVPEDAFEQYLITYGYDDVLDDYVVTDSIIGVEELYLPSGGDVRFFIDDLTGLQDFESLKKLKLSDQFVTSYDFNQNPNLETLEFFLRGFNKIQSNSLKNLKYTGVSLDSIDLKNCPNLEKFEYMEAGIQFVNLAENDSLKVLIFAEGDVPMIDVTNNNLLETLEINGSLTEIDLSQNLALNRLDLESNLITDLDVSGNTALTYFNVNYNRLNSLNIKNGTNTGITYFQADQNPGLTCIQVDDVAFSTTNWTRIDAVASFSVDCEE